MVCVRLIAFSRFDDPVGIESVMACRNIGQASVDIRLEHRDFLVLDCALDLSVAQRFSHTLTCRCVITFRDRSFDDRDHFALAW